MNRTRWLAVGIVVLRVMIFSIALVIGRGVALRALVRTEAAMLTAMAVWLLMLYFLPRVRDLGFAALDARRGVLRAALLALAMLGLVIGAAIVMLIGRNLIFSATLIALLLLGMEFSSGIVLASFGFGLRRAVESSATRSSGIDLILGAQILTALLEIRLAAIVAVIALGFLSLGVLAYLALSVLKKTETM